MQEFERFTAVVFDLGQIIWGRKEGVLNGLVQDLNTAQSGEHLGVEPHHRSRNVRELFRLIHLHGSFSHFWVGPRSRFVHGKIQRYSRIFPDIPQTFASSSTVAIEAFRLIQPEIDAKKLQFTYIHRRNQGEQRTVRQPCFIWTHFDLLRPTQAYSPLKVWTRRPSLLGGPLEAFRSHLTVSNVQFRLDNA